MNIQGSTSDVHPMPADVGSVAYSNDLTSWYAVRRRPATLSFWLKVVHAEQLPIIQPAFLNVKARAVGKSLKTGNRVFV